MLHTLLIWDTRYALDIGVGVLVLEWVDLTWRIPNQFASVSSRDYAHVYGRCVDADIMVLKLSH